MEYRNWKITAQVTFLGYLVQYVSPFGQAHRTSPYFPTDEQAIAYARTRIDYLLDCEQSHFDLDAPAPAGRA